MDTCNALNPKRLEIFFDVKMLKLNFKLNKVAEKEVTKKKKKTKRIYSNFSLEQE